MRIEFTSVIDRPSLSLQGTSPLSTSGFREAGRRARLLEQHNFDRLLIADQQGLPDNNELGSFMLHGTTSLSIAISHRAGVVAPTVAAQQFATLDQLGSGRLAISMVNGGASGLDARIADHAADLACTDEYLVLLKRLWANTEPLDHEGPFYSIKQGAVSARPFSPLGIPLTLGGISGTAIKVAARHADMFALGFSSPAQTRQTVSRVLAQAQTVGRAAKIRFSLDIRPVLTPTRPASQGRGHQAGGVLAGTPENIALTLVDYCRCGVSEFVVHGLEQHGEMVEFAESVIPLVRRSVGREAANNTATPSHWQEGSVQHS